MKVYRSLDFASAKSRIEPNDPGEYEVHSEDFESINDLVRRAERTRTKLPDFSSDTVEYDTRDVFLEDAQFDFEDLNRSQRPAVDASKGSVDAERSEAATPPADVSDRPSETQ